MFRDINLDLHGLIEASAGTGKTYTIERLVLRLLVEKKAQLESILVVTFTDAAAMELRARIRGLLELACAGAGIDGYPIPQDTVGHLRRELLAFDRAAIFTIHGFCNRVMARWPLETGLARGSAIVDEKSLADVLVAEEMRAEWEQWDRASQGALTREIAGEGLEKFRGMVCGLTARYAPGLVDLSPAPVAGSEDFSRSELPEKMAELAAAIRELAPAFIALYGQCPRPHQFSYKKFQPGSQAGAIAWCVAAAESRCLLPEGKVAGAMAAFGWIAADKKHRQIAEAAACWDQIAGLKCELDALAKTRAKVLTTSLAASLRRRLDSHRVTTGSISYDDMIRSVERGIARGSGALLSRLRSQYRYGIIDEFQDTNALQWNIFRRVFMEGDQGRLFVVGDPKQSIFRVQDADVYTYLEAREHFEAGSQARRAKRYTLAVNHRSINGLVEACNAVFSRNDWFGVEGIPFVPAQAEAGKIDNSNTGRVAQGLNPPAPVLLRPLYGLPDIATGKFGPLVSSQRFSYARYIVSKIIEWHDRGLPYSSMALLYETRTYAGPVLQLLREAGIPYTQYKEKGLFISDESLNWACLLEYLAENTPRNFKKLLITDFFGVDPGEVVAGAGLERFEAMAVVWQQLAVYRQWPRLMHAVFADTALLLRAARRTDGKRVIAAYRQIGEWIAARLIADHLSPREIARRLRAFHAGVRTPGEEEERFRRETEEDAVRATTIHSSKGLQFDVVFILAGAAGKSAGEPFVVRSEAGKRRGKILVSLDKEHKVLMAEEDECERRRLLYVGLTRARYKMVAPLWKEPSPGKALPAYDTNLLAASAANPALFEQDLVVVGAAGSRAEASAFVRPRAGGLSSSDTEAVSAVDKGLQIEALRIRIAGRRRLLHSYTSLAHGERDGREEWGDEPHEGGDGISGILPAGLVIDADSVFHEGQSAPANIDRKLSGRQFGTALHSVLEEIDFAIVNSDEEILLRKINDRFGAAGLLDKNAEKRAQSCRQIAGLVTAALTLPIPLAGATLRPVDIPEKDRQTETFFAAMAGRSGGAVAPEKEAVDRVIGFIDLVFRRGKDMYLLDWKSDTLDSYDKVPLLEAMHRSGYTIQAALYATSFHRWLWAAGFGAAGYTLRGVCYLFLRGPAAVTIPVTPDSLRSWSAGLGECVAMSARRKLATAGSAYDG